MDQKTRADRILGCLIGGAIGDSIGALYENLPPDAVVTGMQQDNLYVTDDTQLTLATCEAIVQAGSVDPEMIAARMTAWFREGRINGIGSSTLKALTEMAAGAHWASAGASGERSAGNGAAMRVAPLAFFLDPSSDDDRRTLHDVCRITHRNEEAYCGALAIMAAVRLAAEGVSLKEELLPSLLKLLPDSVTRDRLQTAHTEKLTIVRAAKQFGTSGHVAESVPMAILFAMEAPGSIAGMMGGVVATGGDTDTIGSMAAQIFGASKGAAGLTLDQSFLKIIDLGPEVKEAAEKLAAVPT